MTDTVADGPHSEVSVDTRRVRRERPDDLPTYYANNVAFRSSLWDITLDFGVILEAGENEFAFRDLATVIMSPQHARVFAELLTEHVRRYEELFGRIPRQDEVEKALEGVTGG